MKLLWAIALVLLCGCGHKIVEGDIVGKEHEDARTWTTIMPIRVGKSTIFVPMTHYDDEDWIINIEGCDSEGKFVKESFYVSEDVFNSLSVGEYFVYDPNKAETTDPVCKKRQEKPSD